MQLATIIDLLVLIAIIGRAVAGFRTGLLAGARWIVREIQSRAAEAEHAAAEAHRRASEAAMGPKDLGSLEWDAEASVYRPVRRG